MLFEHAADIFSTCEWPIPGPFEKPIDYVYLRQIHISHQRGLDPQWEKIKNKQTNKQTKQG